MGTTHIPTLALFYFQLWQIFVSSIENNYSLTTAFDIYLLVLAGYYNFGTARYYNLGTTRYYNFATARNYNI